ncbi:DUF4314 domain-containing protein [Micromonospora chalcea]|uniref:DUF4314 domain-containing protein n=1 Tax=Micromonospora chalcea TaxID=1874 RepID=UPI0021A5717A|nr:DUF4314 domain-containing protein [Micromonospora chalcea]MCT2279679.1 DUF4314 domain-containing protein [Micromonospora chalcea]
MTSYETGQRIALVHTSDPHTLLRPGDTGTVRRHDQRHNIVEFTWDSGSTLSMCLDDGDRIAPATTPPPTGDPVGEATEWAAALRRMRAAGTEAGQTAAEWWAQDTIGARSAATPAWPPAGSWPASTTAIPPSSTRCPTSPRLETRSMPPGGSCSPTPPAMSPAGSGCASSSATRR